MFACVLSYRHVTHMGISQFIKNIGGQVRAKKYLGILPTSLPANSRNWAQGDFLTANEISLYVNKAIAKRADKVSEIQFVLHDAKGNKIEKHPLLDLLALPNGVFTGQQFWKLWQIYFDLIGETYISVESTNRAISADPERLFDPKKITALHLLIPTFVKPIYNKDTGLVEKYQYQNSSVSVEYDPSEIIYTHNPDPKSPMRGVSLLKAGINAISTEAQISTYHSRILENGGKVEGVFKFDTGPITKDQLEKMKDDYKKEYAESKRSGVPLFLGGGADYVRTGLNPDELSFLEAKKMTFEDICILTSVPKSMLASTTDVKFDNADADRAIFLRETIVPLLRTLTMALDQKLFPDGMNLTFVDPTPENLDEKRKNIETASNINAISTNEKREALRQIGFELDPVNEGKNILVPFNLTTLRTVDNPVDSVNNSAKGKSVTKDESNANPLADYDIRRMYWNIQTKRMDSREKMFVREIQDYFSEQEERLLSKLQPEKGKRKTKAQFDELLSIDVEVNLGKEKLTPLMVELLKQAGIDAVEFAGSAGAFVMTDDIRSWLDKRMGIFMRQINETTFKKLRQDFVDSITAEEGREGLISRIQSTYGDTKKARAALIARTEVHNATQYGTMQGYKQAGLTTKIWVAVMDGATRDTHASVDGEERPIDRTFSNGLMFPGDPNGPAEEVINCRCVL